MADENIMLLVGGPCDGRRVKITGAPSVYYMPRVNRLDMSINPRDEPEEVSIRAIADEYIRVGPAVYFHVSISDSDVFDVLTSGYRCEIGA